MKKKTIVDRRYGNVLLESYKKSTDPDSPILGSFSVEGMAAENTVSQNETYYSTQLWAMPSALGKGGTYVDENGKLKPTKLFGSLDHPLAEDADAMLFRLEEAAIVWKDINRNTEGKYNGSADILNTPSGKIVKTLLDYAKINGGGEVLGVSSRGLGESRAVNEGYNEVIPESYELLSFDFVYNPSFSNRAILVEASRNRKPLTEAIKNLAKEDKEHANIYNEYAEFLEKEVNMNKLFEESSVENAKKDYIRKLKEEIHKLANAIYELDMMDPEEFKDKYPNKGYDKAMSKLRKEKAELEKHLDEVLGKEVVEEATEVIEEKTKEVVVESTDLDDALEDFDEELSEFADAPEDEEELEEELEDEEAEDEEEESEEDEEEFPEEVDLNMVFEKLEEVLNKLNELEDFLSPVEDYEVELDEEELDEEELAEDYLEDLEDLDLEVEDEFEEAEFDLSLLSDEELEALVAEEEEYLKKNA